jgi:hypothetical protein
VRQRSATGSAKTTREQRAARTDGQLHRERFAWRARSTHRRECVDVAALQARTQLELRVERNSFEARDCAHHFACSPGRERGVDRLRAEFTRQPDLRDAQLDALDERRRDLIRVEQPHFENAAGRRAQHDLRLRRRVGIERRLHTRCEGGAQTDGVRSERRRASGEHRAEVREPRASGFVAVGVRHEFDLVRKLEHLDARTSQRRASRVEHERFDVVVALQLDHTRRGFVELEHCGAPVARSLREHVRAHSRPGERDTSFVVRGQRLDVRRQRSDARQIALALHHAQQLGAARRARVPDHDACRRERRVRQRIDQMQLELTLAADRRELGLLLELGRLEHGRRRFALLQRRRLHGRRQIARSARSGRRRWPIRVGANLRRRTREPPQHERNRAHGD